jgi:predicted nucleic acid-binding protein
MNKFVFLKDFEPKGSHQFLIDTNILMYLFSPIASYSEKKQEQISRFLDTCRQIQAGLITTSFVLGEFFHVNLGMYYDNWCKIQKHQISFNFKDDYRPTDDFKDSVSIATHCYNAEFTDSYLLELSNINGWIIVSNDSDLLKHPNRKHLLVTLNK